MMIVNRLSQHSTNQKSRTNDNHNYKNGKRKKSVEIVNASVLRNATFTLDNVTE